MPPKPPKPAKPDKADKAAKAVKEAAKAAKAAKAPPVAPPEPAAQAVDPLQRGRLDALLDRLQGARLVYGEPVREAGRTVIPVARLRAQGGWGHGWGDSEEHRGGGGGAGGGGKVDARPIGFIEIGPEGTRFQVIDDPEATTRLLRTATAAAVALATAAAGLRAARGRRLLGPGRR